MLIIFGGQDHIWRPLWIQKLQIFWYMHFCHKFIKIKSHTTEDILNYMRREQIILMRTADHRVLLWRSLQPLTESSIKHLFKLVKEALLLKNKFKVVITIMTQWICSSWAETQNDLRRTFCEVLGNSSKINLRGCSSIHLMIRRPK